MAILIDAEHREEGAHLLNGCFALRKKIFVDLLKWSLPSGDAPLEFDQFDGGDTCHLASLTKTGQVRGTLRAGPSLAPNVSCDVLGAQIGVTFPRGPDVAESSRICVDLSLPPPERRAARADLYVSYMELCAAKGWTRTLGILRMASLQDFIRCGLHVDFLSPPTRFGSEQERSIAFVMETDVQGWDRCAAVLGFRTALQMPWTDTRWASFRRDAA